MPEVPAQGAGQALRHRGGTGRRPATLSGRAAGAARPVGRVERAGAGAGAIRWWRLWRPRWRWCCCWEREWGLGWPCGRWRRRRGADSKRGAGKQGRQTGCQAKPTGRCGDRRGEAAEKQAKKDARTGEVSKANTPERQRSKPKKDAERAAQSGGTRRNEPSSRPIRMANGLAKAGLEGAEGSRAAAKDLAVRNVGLRQPDHPGADGMGAWQWRAGPGNIWKRASGTCAAGNTTTSVTQFNKHHHLPRAHRPGPAWPSAPMANASSAAAMTRR